LQYSVDVVCKESMAVSRTLVLCLLLAAVRKASALAVGRPDDAEPDAPWALEADADGDKQAQLLGSRSDDEADIGDDDVGVDVDYPGCAPEERETLARSLKEKYREEFESKIEDVFQSVERPTYLTVGESRNKAILRNFLAHVESTTRVDNVTSTVVNVQLDVDGMAACKEAELHYTTERLHIECVNLAGWLPSVFFGSGINAGPWSCVYNMIIWSKPEIFLTATNTSQHDVMLIDTDVVIYHDMFKLGEEAFFNNSEAKLAVAHELRGYRNPNTGVVLGTKAGVDMISWWTWENFHTVNQFSGDQTAFSNLAKFGDNLHFWKQLAVIRWPEVGQCGNQGIWATHYNCMGGKKQRFMMNNTDWHEDSWARLIKSERHARQNVVEAMKASGDWWITE